MKIAVVGTQCIGKSTFIKDFLDKWSMYSTPTKTYRDVVKERNISINKLGSEESQQIILDFLVDQATQYSKSDNVIFDRCILDNLAYSSWLHLNGKVSEKFLDTSRIIVRESLKLFDIIFFLPITKTSPVSLVEDGVRDTDPVYREEIDNIFKAFYQSYLQADGRVFPKDDTPAFIEIFGNQVERVALTSLYLTDLGTAYGEKESLLSDLS
jgi:predicted ATPase